jgi:hypothetical protein
MLISTATDQSTGAVSGALREAARATGTSFEYLLATARVESRLDPNAAASTSSARGLFQFIDQTWLATLKQAGPSLGYGHYADAIVRTASGRHEVRDPTVRRQIMALRHDPTASAVMAGAFTRRNAARLAGRLGRAPSGGELYVAHFLGPSGAARLITLAADHPNVIAADVFPNAASANRSVFYDNRGRARTVADVYGELAHRYDLARAGSTPAAGAGNRATDPLRRPRAAAFDPSTYLQAPQTNTAAAPVFHGLFRNDPSRAAISQFVQDLWSSRPRVAAALSGRENLALSTSGPGGSGFRPVMLAKAGIQ